MAGPARGSLHVRRVLRMWRERRVHLLVDETLAKCDSGERGEVALAAEDERAPRAVAAVAAVDLHMLRPTQRVDPHGVTV